MQPAADKTGTPKAAPVVHFEVIGEHPERLRTYYAKLFGWKYDTSSAVSQEVSEAGNYGFIDRMTSADGTGIRGGVGGGEGYASHTVFYVGVPDVEAALQKAEALGGTRLLGPATKPGGGLTIGQFRDPDGNLIGVAGPK